VRAVISQRLLPGMGGGRAAALEIMLDTPRIKDLIKRGEIHVLKDAMEQSAVDGCQTFDSALYALCAAGKITAEEALRGADSANNLRLRLERLHAGTGSPNGTSLRLAGEAAKHPMSGLRPAASVATMAARPAPRAAVR